MAEDCRTAGAKVRPDTRRWQGAVESEVREHGFDAVIESVLADADEFRASARAYRRSAHGSRSWPWPPRRPSASSGSWATYWPRAARTWRNHDTCAGVCRTLAVIEAEHLADRITVPALPPSSPATGRCSTRPDCAPTWTASGHLRDRTHALHARGVPAVKAPVPSSARAFDPNSDRWSGWW
ncbi:zeta toxin family protein [Streptomyces sp. NBC_01187]|uniref:zeta toxin family protein n=1 Tax=Streptomyces sp. NBC_01187 TaxID=2903766 RepID=UPI002F9110A7|nr:zeta toxin family protein [Streptomyces sp. NBC_01187]WSS46998.1 zeta toxin family protein [Streptomyces sp. NBC_01187]